MDPGVVQRMKDVEKVVLDLDESIRVAAFSMMETFILKGSTSTGPPSHEGSGESNADSSDSLGAFLSGRDLTKPAEQALAIAAYLFSEYGSEPFTLQEVRAIADEVGFTLPERLDMTFKSARRKGKPIFRTVGRGNYAPTVLGETTLREEYDISKGRKRREQSERSES